MAQNLKISGSYVDSNMQDVFHDIENHYPIRFFYREQWLTQKKINQHFNQQSLNDVLELLLETSDLAYVTYGSDKVILVKKVKMEGLNWKEYVPATPLVELAQVDGRFPMLIVGDSLLSEKRSRNSVRLELMDMNEDYPLDGVTVYFEKLKSTFNSDKDGLVDLTLPNGIHQMEVRHVGYEPFIANLRVFSSGSVSVGMELEILELKEVIVSGEGPDNRLMSPQSGIVTITPKQIKDMPVFLGEADVIQTIQTIPGVTTIGEGAPGFFVRGGNIDQNLVLQDEVVFSNSSHALGFFSLFNPDLISEVQLLKGNIPAQYGGRLSSILDVRLKGNDYTNTTINGGVGTVMSKIAVMTPIVKEKVSLLAGGRISYADWLLPVINVPEIQESEAFFYDFNIKMSAKVSESSSISAGYFQSFDRVNFESEAGFEWSIKNLSFKWDQRIGKSIQSEFIAAMGQTDNLSFDPSGLDLTELGNGLQFWKLKENIVITLNDHLLIGGSEWIYYQPQDEVLRTIGSQNFENQLPKDYGQEWGFYLNDEWEVNEKLALSAGLRTSIFFSEDRRNVISENQQYINLEPRISFRYGLGSSSSVKASYNKMSQYIHLLSATTGVLPDDQWILSNAEIAPSKSNNFSLGYFRNFSANAWESSAEIFYRRMTDIVEFKDFADLVLNPDIEEEILQGDGKAYGLEFLLRRHTGKIKGNISYTFSRTFVKVPEGTEDIDLNWFPAKFDRPHTVNLVMDWTVNRKSRFALVFNFSSGRPITAPVSNYRLGNVVVPHYSSRNEYRIPDYHRLDLSYTYKRNAVKRRKYQDSITFSIYNIYGRRNAFSVFFRKENNIPAKAFRLSVLGSAFPSITYTFEFK